MEASSLCEQFELGGWPTCLPLCQSARAAGQSATDRGLQQHTFTPHGPEARSPRPRRRQSRCPVRAVLLVCRWPPFPVSSYGGLGERASSQV